MGGCHLPHGVGLGEDTCSLQDLTPAFLGENEKCVRVTEARRRGRGGTGMHSSESMAAFILEGRIILIWVSE